jgi:hypothetical protein
MALPPIVSGKVKRSYPGLTASGIKAGKAKFPHIRAEFKLENPFGKAQAKFPYNPVSSVIFKTVKHD